MLIGFLVQHLRFNKTGVRRLLEIVVFLWAKLGVGEAVPKPGWCELLNPIAVDVHDHKRGSGRGMA